MENTVVREETLYTYDEATSRYEIERHHTWLWLQGKLAEIKREQYEKRRYFCNQKLYGMLIVVLSVPLLALTLDPVLIVGIGFGVFLMATKRMVIYNEYFRTHGGGNKWKI